MTDKRTGIEPHKMNVPAMDRPSVTFAWMLDSFVIGDRGQVTGENQPVLACNQCDKDICYVDEGDTLRVLFNTALAHTCQ